MLTLLVVIFVIGYAAIALEHSIGVNKTASARSSEMVTTPVAGS